ncbi:hypothetical protein OGZ51_07125 [Lactococcus lactis]|uniref:ABC-three component systems C-terminal domain-containing protein n=1 Tax=Lactococcus lactis TaxID=1358 RepID=A0A9X4NHN0_9LACT|nr:ABC-three component system protein [Lactococcus lactis]MDG4983912.1 hypothetical protein [Lactococcus lactis]
MQKGLAANQSEAGQLLFGVLERSEVFPLSLNASDSFLSQLINHKKEIPESVRKASKHPEVIQEVKNHFSQVIVPRLNTQLMDDTCTQLLATLDGDRSISNEKRSELHSYRHQISDFLAECFLYALNRENRQNQQSWSTLDNVPSPKMRMEDGKIWIDDKIVVLDPHLQVPKNVKKIELPYVTALIEAYADAADCQPLSVEQFQEDLKQFGKYHQNFDEQRQNYYAIEGIRRKVRDSFVSEEHEHQFSELKNDLYAGVSDWLLDDYENGFERLKAVLKQSVNLSLNRSILSQLPGLIGYSQKKGICHLLVNDGRMTWVNQDETSF